MRQLSIISHDNQQKPSEKNAMDSSEAKPMEIDSNISDGQTFNDSSSLYQLNNNNVSQSSMNTDKNVSNKNQTNYFNSFEASNGKVTVENEHNFNDKLMNEMNHIHLINEIKIDNKSLINDNVNLSH